MKDLIIDCFAGGGGASVGIEMALGRPVDIAINHDPDAILQQGLQCRVWQIPSGRIGKAEEKMKDRYLFRAKRIDDGEWVEGFLVKKHGLFFIYDIINSDACRQSNYNVDPTTLCQCTGLIGRNGQLIWENDIVKYHFGEKYAQIKYGIYQNCFDSVKTGHCGFYVDWPEKTGWRKDLGYWINMVNAEVVGNIFDNPELLEQEG